MVKRLAFPALVLLLAVGGAEAQQASFGCFRAGDVKAGPNCDLTELLAASRAWAGLMSPGSWRKENDGAWHQTWEFVDFRGDVKRAEQRWRKAVEACQ